ncbi:MAG: Hpt domain-containing protein [Sphingomonadales bacterium]|nr:Hpt domain-containing protein [Sphingomonadales bacterium]
MSANNDMFQELTDRFIESTIDRLESLDQLIDQIYNGKGERGEQFRKFSQEIHSLKGSAGTFGFHLVSTIAHRLEDYMESSKRLEKDQWLDVQKFIDAIRLIFEAGHDPEQDQHGDILSQLPSSSKQEQDSTTLLLVMTSGLIRKHLGTDLAAKGYDISFANDPVQAIDIALKIKPDVVISSQEFANITGLELAKALKVIDGTKHIKFALMTGNKKLVKKLGHHHDGMCVIYKDKDIAENITKCFKC